MSDTTDGDGADCEKFETPGEAHHNRGIITVYEQTKDTETWDEGDRFVQLGKDGRRHIYDGSDECDMDFVPVAVPLAHIELHTPLAGEDEFSEWVESDAGQLALRPFFPGMEDWGIDVDVLTEWGVERFEDGDAQ